MCLHYFFIFFFFNDTATTEIYTLSLHDALPISRDRTKGSHKGKRMMRTNTRTLSAAVFTVVLLLGAAGCKPKPVVQDRKSTRLNSSHLVISYAVFCLKKKKKRIKINNTTTI